MRGYVQIYTGDGKGKTTAALGQALRAAGAGLRVYIAQFLKEGDYAEIEALRRFDDLITCRQFGRPEWVVGEPTKEQIEAARVGLKVAREVMAAGECEMVVLDEANVAVDFGLIGVDDLMELIDAKPEHVELVITGRRADPRLIARADLVTEMRNVKHYYERGVAARRGIEK